MNIRRWGAFLSGGVVNTLLTYGIYVALNRLISYQLAYFIAYAFGILLSYWINAKWVFKGRLTWRGLLSYPLVYVVQYTVSALGLGFLVGVAKVQKDLAPLCLVIVMLPLTYLMSKLVIRMSSGTGR